MDEKTRNYMRLAANFLAHGFVLGFAVLLTFVALYLTGGIWAYGIHSKWFNLSYESYCFIMFSIMVTLKLCTLFFFGIPWLAIRIMLIRRSKPTKAT